MPFFRYTASDSHGLRVEGTLQALDTGAARQALTQAGYSTIDVAPLQNAHQPKPMLRPSVGSLAGTQGVPVSAPPRQAPPPPAAAPAVQADVVVKGGRASGKALAFLLSQLSAFYKSGISPSDALQHLADRSPERYRASVTDAARRVGAGESLADCFERYPSLYPTYVVGMIRVGEASGNTDEALMVASETAMLAHRAWRRLSWMLYAFVFMLAVAPLSMGVVQGALSSIRVQDQAGGSLPPVATLVQEIVGQMQRYGLVTLAVLFGAWLLIYVWNLPRFRMARHTVALRLPFLGSRSRHESVSRFSWALGLAMRAGLPAYSAMSMAAQSIPNLKLREQLEREVGHMRENEPLSSALRRSQIVAPEWTNVIETGEMTGTAPSALEQVSNASTTEFRTVDSALPRLGLIAATILGGVIFAPIIIHLFVSWYGGLIDYLLNDGT